SFSAKVAGDSKLLETKPRLVAAYLYPGQADALERLESLIHENGASKVPLPVIMSGPISLGELRLGDDLEYWSVPHSRMGDLTIDDGIEYVLTIENMTSF